jgi:opacity protein-like surface antigen
MKTTCLALLLSCLFTVSYSQALWKKGEVVLKDGTRLSGTIDDREWVISPKEIEFKEEGKAATKYTPQDLLEFSTERPVKYKSLKVSYDGDTQVLSNLPALREPSEVMTAQVFLEVVIDSKFSLLFMEDKNGRKHFFLQEDNNVNELVDRWYGDKSNASHYERFKQQLILVTNDCPELQTQARKLKYMNSNLANFFKELNKCKGAEVTLVWAGPTTTIKKRPVFGVSAQLIFSNINFAYAESKMGSPNYGIGVFGEFYDRKKPNRFSFYSELSYQNISQPEVKYQLAGALVATRLSFPEKSGERHYLMIGLNNTYRMNTVFDEGITYSWAVPDNTDEFIFGFALGAGKSFTIFSGLRLNAELRYTYDRWHTASTGFNGANNIGLNLQFYRKR